MDQGCFIGRSLALCVHPGPPIKLGRHGRRFLGWTTKFLQCNGDFPEGSYATTRTGLVNQGKTIDQKKNGGVAAEANATIHTN